MKKTIFATLLILSGIATAIAAPVLEDCRGVCTPIGAEELLKSLAEQKKPINAVFVVDAAAAPVSLLIDTDVKLAFLRDVIQQREFFILHTPYAWTPSDMPRVVTIVDRKLQDSIEILFWRNQLNVEQLIDAISDQRDMKIRISYPDRNLPELFVGKTGVADTVWTD